MTTHIEEIEAMRQANNASFAAGHYRHSPSVAHFVRFDRSAAIIAAKGALAETRAAVAAAWERVKAAGETEGEAERMRLFRAWQRMDEDLRAIHHTRPPEGSLQEHAARWLSDPSDENRARLALFVA